MSEQSAKLTSFSHRPLNELSVLELVRLLEEKAISVEALVGDCLDHIAEREAQVKAWVYIDRKAALTQARLLDKGARRGVLHGIPVGIKDIIDTADLPTGYGSDIYRTHQPQIDASVIATLKSQGGVLLGKTVTTEFAHRVPGPTTNPWDVSRTPGGSSSGSAAAVADYMVPLALGTQTTASTIRPASFCGVIGYRPSYGSISCSGIKANAPSFDTLGLFARSVADCSLLSDVLLEKAYAPLSVSSRAPRIGFCRTPFWKSMQPEAAEFIEKAIRQISRRGGLIQDFSLPPELLGVLAAHRTISSYELARALGTERHYHPAQLSATIREGKIAEGMRYTQQEYVTAQITLESARARMLDLLDGVDVLIAPSANGIAPVGLESTGTPEFCTIWTALHVPALTLPLPEKCDSMPLGIQLIGKRGMDRQLFEVALWIEQALGAVNAIA